MAGNPSGIAATAKEIEVKNISSKSLPWKNEIIKIRIHIPTAKNPRIFPSSLNFFCNGVSSFSSCSIILAILPISVFIPVPTTTPTPRPYVARVDIKAILFWSPIGISLSGKKEASFSEGTDSPVKADSSIFKFAVSINLKSPGIYLPASIITISPGTISSERISFKEPSLLTRALGVESSFKASKAFSALDSWITPITAFIIMTKSIIKASLISPKNADIIAAMISI